MTKTYTELFYKRWDGDTKEDSFLSGLEDGEKRAWNAIEVLDSRGGFDHWWCDMDEECRDDIFKELRLILSK